MNPADATTLRAKYLDWCSAQVADRFLELTPDQIYDLAYGSPSGLEDGQSVASIAPGSSEAEKAAECQSNSAASSSSPVATWVASAGDPESGIQYRVLVERVAEMLAARMQLPSFDEWVEAYLAAPDRYEAELLGFWRGRS